MPLAFTPIEAVIVKAINQDEFIDFSYQNVDWRCLERGEVPKDDMNDGRRALRDDLQANLKGPMPMIPIVSPQSANNDVVSSTITIVKTDHMPIPHTEAKRPVVPLPLQLDSISSSSSISSTSSSPSVHAQPKPSLSNSTRDRSPLNHRATTDQTDM